MKCKVCQVETPQRIRCGALVCEACKRFFMRQKRQHPNGEGIKCKHGNQCLKETQDKAKVTQRGWFWRGLCPACRFKKCIKIGMQYQDKKVASKVTNFIPPQVSSLTQHITIDSMEETQVKYLPNHNSTWLFDISERMKQELQIQQQLQQKQQECQFLVYLFANEYLSQYLNQMDQSL